MADDDLEALLTRIGLSKKEIDTYLSLLEHGEAKASTIAEAANVSKRYVYSVSSTLEDRGLVEVNDHAVPTTIRALPPQEVVDRLREEVDAMQPHLERRYSTTEPAAEQFEVIKAQVTVLKRIRAFIESAQSEIALAIPGDHLETVRDELTAAAERGVLVMLIVSGVEDLPDAASYASVARVWEEPMPTMLAVDGNVGLVAPPEMMRRANSDSQAIVLAQEQLSPVVVGSFLGNYWPSAREVSVRDPDDLPRTFVDFRHTVLAATLHLRADDDLYADVRGRYTADDGPAEVSGQVVDVRQGLVMPTNNEFPVENALVIDTGEERVTIGGKGAFVEDIEAENVVLKSDAT